ncbi:MAG: hypothetical protein JSC189_000901 [Candidatus Tokpelaia sp. JSC189]|nr:MAG: hypothetical protein JSC189_000901 [Candidatus Tokpelaia sp. JSC189]
MNNVANTILNYLGSAPKVARILRLNTSYVYRWRKSPDEGGRGTIPDRYQRTLLDYAKDHRIDLRPDDFFYPDRLQKIMAENPEKIHDQTRTPYAISGRECVFEVRFGCVCIFGDGR